MIEPARYPPADDIFHRWFVGALLLANAVLVATAMQDDGWGVMVIFVSWSPITNATFAFLGATATVVLKRKSPGMSVSHHIALVVGAPIAGVLAVPFVTARLREILTVIRA